MMPVVLKDVNTGEKIKFIFFAFVVPNLPVPIFLSLEAMKKNLDMESSLSERGKTRFMLKTEDEKFIVETK